MEKDYALCNILIPFIIALLLLSNSVMAGVGGISKVYVTNNPDMSGDEVWLVKWTETGYNTDRLRATITPDDVDDLNPGHEVTDKDFIIESDGTDDGCVYDIVLNDEQIPRTIEAITNDFCVTYCHAERDSWIQSNCEGWYVISESHYWCWDGIGTEAMFCDRVYCYRDEDYLGAPADISPPDYVFSTDWTITAEGKTPQTATLSNAQSESGITEYIGSNVMIEWQGNLMSGETCGEAYHEYALHSNDFTDGWRVIDKGTYESWKNYYLGNQIKDDLLSWANEEFDEVTFEWQNNNRAQNSIKEKTSGAFATQNLDVSDSSLYNGKLHVDAGDDTLVFPAFNIYVKSSYLEIIIPCGEPLIKDVSINIIEEGTSEKAEVTVKNTAIYRGGFNIWISECTNGFEPSDYRDGITLDPGEEYTTKLSIGGQSISGEDPEIKGTCIVKMESTGYGCEGEDDYEFDVTLKQIQECPPGHKKCAVCLEEDVGCDAGDEVVKECNLAGLKYEIIDVCDGENEVCDNAECKVIDKPPVCGDGICEGTEILTCPQDCTTPPVCGNGICELGESYVNCPEDCKGPSFCGNGICEAGETEANCPADCKVSDDPYDECVKICRAQTICGPLDFGCAMKDTFTDSIGCPVMCWLTYNVWNIIFGASAFVLLFLGFLKLNPLLGKVGLILGAIAFLLIIFSGVWGLIMAFIIMGLGIAMLFI